MMLKNSLPLLSDIRGGVLARLLQDHRSSLACVELLEQQLSESGSTPRNAALAVKLVEQLIDSPDDFHHMTERRLFRRLWLRLGDFLPRYIDLDELHDERRERRIDVIRFVDRRAAAFLEDGEFRDALTALCLCVRSQTEIEERCFFPLLRRHLTADDWSLAEDEIEAYNAAWQSICGGERETLTV